MSLSTGLNTVSLTTLNASEVNVGTTMDCPAITGVATINGSAYPPPSIAGVGKGEVAVYTSPLGGANPYPCRLLYGSVATPAENITGLLTITVNIQLQPFAPFVGSDWVVLEFKWANSPLQPSPLPNNFNNTPQMTVFIPDGTAYPTLGWGFSLTAKTLVTLPSTGGLTYEIRALSSNGNHAYIVNTGAVAGEAIVSLLYPISV